MSCLGLDQRKIMTIRFISAALAVGFALNPIVYAGSFPDDVPVLGYSPANMDKSVSPRNDFYHYAAGNWLKLDVQVFNG